MGSAIARNSFPRGRGRGGSSGEGRAGFGSGAGAGSSSLQRCRCHPQVWHCSGEGQRSAPSPTSQPSPLCFLRLGWSRGGWGQQSFVLPGGKQIPIWEELGGEGAGGEQAEGFSRAQGSLQIFGGRAWFGFLLARSGSRVGVGGGGCRSCCPRGAEGALGADSRVLARGLCWPNSSRPRSWRRSRALPRPSGTVAPHLPPARS